MAILKIRDENGNVQEILAIKGEKGDPGKSGTTISADGSAVTDWNADTKLDKVTTSGSILIYGVNTGGNQTMLSASMSAAKNSIPRADANGCISTKTPTGELHATNKAYVDKAVSNKADVIQTTSGSVIVTDNSAHAPLKGLKLFGKTTQNGTPTPTAPVELESVGASGNIVVTVSGDQGNQTLTVSTPKGLPGIPVPSGGNYTDENGQQWICDEIDFARGVYVQRVKQFVVDENTSFNKHAYTTDEYFVCYTANTGAAAVKNCISNLFVNNTSSNMLKTSACIYIQSDTKDPLHFSVPISIATGTTSFKNWAIENDLCVLYPLATPTETALSTEELEAYAKLHTNEPNTTVLNDAGAGMEISYYTPSTAVQMVHSPKDVGKVLAIDEHGCVGLKNLPTEAWTFTLEDGSTVTKSVVLK